MARSTRLTALPQPEVSARVVTEFGRLVLELRKAKGLSQSKVARSSGVSPGYVGLMETGERGERPGLEIVRRLCQGLQATVEESEALLRASGHLGANESLISGERLTFAAYVESDKRLSGQQKELLKMQYESWLGQGAASA